MTNYREVQENVYKDANSSLIIYDKVNKGFVEIENFYTSDSNGLYTGYGDGKIETIKIGKSALKGVPAGAYFTNSIKSEVATWLESSDDFNSVVDVLQKGTDEQIADIVYAFQGGQFY